MEILKLIRAISIQSSIAIITLFTGIIIAKISKKIVKKVLIEAEINTILNAAGFRPLSEELARITEYIIYGITIFIILQQFGITRILINALIAIIIVVLIITTMISTRHHIPNAITGLFIKKKIKKYLGKKIQIDNIKGKLEEIGISSIKIKNKEEYHIPYLYLKKHKIKQLQAN